MRSDYHAGTTWAPAGETLQVEATGARFAVNMISAVAPTGEMRFRLVEGTLNAPVFADFIERLAVGRQGAQGPLGRRWSSLASLAGHSAQAQAT